MAVDQDGHAVLCNVSKRVILHHFNFKERIGEICFSPDGALLAISLGSKMRIWRAPSGESREFAPLVLHKTIGGHTDDIVTMDWSKDSRFIVTASLDMTARIFDLRKQDLNEDFVPLELVAHRHPLVAAYFDAEDQKVITIARNGSMFTWRFNPKRATLPDGGSCASQHHLALEKNTTDTKAAELEVEAFRKSKICCVDFNKERNLLVAGFSSGLLGLYSVEPFEMIYSLGISQSEISAVSVNRTGEWLALGCKDLGQLVVWEWRSESFILKQQGHAAPMECLAYSGDGQTIATGSRDGKVKLWTAQAGLCFVTFSEHRAAVTGVEFTKQGKVVVSASNDGTVRAYDMLRYRNFRTFTTPTPVQFMSLAVDPSGEIVAAGTLDTFEVYLWSMQTGQLLEVLSGHTGPISALSFDPIGHLLASASWDKSVRLWEVFSRNKNMQELPHSTEVLAIAFRPDGQEISAATLKGEIVMWSTDLASIAATIEARRDYAEKPLSTASMCSLCYSPDGSVLLAGGSFPFVGLYDIASRILLRRFPVTKIRRDKREESASVHVTGVRASPTGRAWAALSQEGLVIFSLDDNLIFDPFDLEMDLTPASIKEVLCGEKHYLKAFVMALRLNIPSLVEEVWAAVPPEAAGLVTRDLPQKYLLPTVAFFSELAGQTHLVELVLLWIGSLLNEHAMHIRQNRTIFQTPLRLLFKNVHTLYGDLAKVSNHTLYMLDYLCDQPALSLPPAEMVSS